MPTNQILEYLKKHGESLDSKIATAINLPLAQTRKLLNELIEKREIMACESIRFEKGKELRGLSCRITGFQLKAKPGAKPKVQLKLS